MPGPDWVDVMPDRLVTIYENLFGAAILPMEETTPLLIISLEWNGVGIRGQAIPKAPTDPPVGVHRPPPRWFFIMEAGNWYEVHEPKYCLCPRPCKSFIWKWVPKVRRLDDETRTCPYCNSTVEDYDAMCGKCAPTYCGRCRAMTMKLIASPEDTALDLPTGWHEMDRWGGPYCPFCPPEWPARLPQKLGNALDGIPPMMASTPDEAPT